MATKRWINNGPKEGLFYQLTSSDGDVLDAATKESADATVRYLNHLEQSKAKLLAISEEQQDTLERIASAYPSAVEPCKCLPPACCDKCEIAYLLNEWQQAHEPDQPLTTEEEYWTKRGFPATRLDRITRASANL